VTAPTTEPERGASGRRALLGRAVFAGPGLLYVTLFMTIPLLIIASYTVLKRGRFGGVQWEFTLDSFSKALEPTYVAILGNSLLIATVTTVLALALGYPTAYAIARLPRRWRTVALVLVVLPFWSNFLIRTYAWIVLLNSEGPINQVLVNLGVVGAPIELLYNRGAVVVGLLYAYLPLMILPVYASIERVDPQLQEAARNLGAGRLRAFIDVTLPLTVPELLGGGKTVMVGNLIRDQFLEARNWPFGAVLALSVVGFLILLFALQALVARRINGGGARA
jgi:spermidine/putrescine transport system permease protein